MSLLSRLLSPLVKNGVLTVIHASGETEQFGAPSPLIQNVTIRLTDNSLISRILKDPALGAAEAYMDESLEIDEGDIRDLVYLFKGNNPWEGRTPMPNRALYKRLLKNISNHIAQANNKVRSRSNVAHHYDLGNAFYRLFLEEDMQYSCAYFTDKAQTLEEAQRAKKAHIAAKLALKSEQQVLDIGCGWGGMALYLNRVADVHVLGITLSEEQLALARQRAQEAGVADKVRFQLIDYRDLAARGDQFDRVVSVGMFEHVGQPQFDDYFSAVRSLMADDGVMLLHTIGRFGSPGSTDAFTKKYIFPGGYIPALAETLKISEKYRLLASDVETLRLHYGLTIDHWYARTMAARDAIIAMYDERFFRMWTFYLAGAQAAFDVGGMGNYQIQYVKDKRALPLTRDYIARKEAEYMAVG